LFTLKTVLSFVYVDEKKIAEHVVLGFFIKPRFSSSLNLGQNQKVIQRAFKANSRHEPGRDRSRNLDLKNSNDGPTDAAIDLNISTQGDGKSRAPSFAQLR
jgi:hypothetical protein